jgi:hypothetical protein
MIGWNMTPRRLQIWFGIWNCMSFREFAQVIYGRTSDDALQNAEYLMEKFEKWKRSPLDLVCYLDTPRVKRLMEYSEEQEEKEKRSF